jgi:GNAT superfamily N-acetyltransferase
LNLYAEYIKEREGSEIIVLDHGFVTYRQVDGNVFYLVDMYVEKAYRKSGVAWDLHNKVCDIARNAGATQLITSACTDAAGVTVSLKVILAGGFKYSSSNGNMLYFVHDL